MKKHQSYSNKMYSKKTYGEFKDKWDHSGYDALIREDTKREYSPKNYVFKKRKDDNFRYNKEVILFKNFYYIFLNFLPFLHFTDFYIFSLLFSKIGEN